jgi:hypothetical protein
MQWLPNGWFIEDDSLPAQERFGLVEDDSLPAQEKWGLVEDGFQYGSENLDTRQSLEVVSAWKYCVNQAFFRCPNRIFRLALSLSV